MNSFIIPCEMRITRKGFVNINELCDLNNYINVERSNRIGASKVKKQMGVIVSQYCNKLDLPKDTQFDVECIWTTKDKRKDSDNIFFAVKFILDGVVTSGQLQGDGYRYIRNISHKRLIGKEEQVEVIFNLAK